MWTVACGLTVASGVTVLTAQSGPHGSSRVTSTAHAPVRPAGCPAPVGIARAVSPGDVVLGALDNSDDAAPAPGSAGHTVFYARASPLAASDTGAHAGPSPPRITATRPATVKIHASGDVATGGSTTRSTTHSTTRVTTRATARSTPKRPTARHARPWSVQVAAYETLDEAQAMQATLCGRGYEARVVGTVRPYDVRVGHYPTSGAALAVARRLTSRQLTVFVTPSE
jgi:cell division septation protein DedD